MHTNVLGVSDQDLQTYNRQGYLIRHQQLYPPGKLERLVTIVEEYAEEARMGKRSSDFNVPHFDDRRLFEFFMDDALLDLVERFLGPNIALWASQAFCKQPNSKWSVPWHVDDFYWRAFLEPIEVICVLLGLDDCTEINGCPLVVPGSHLWGDVKWERRGRTDHPFLPYRVRKDQFDESAVANIELGRGEYLLFDGHLLHGSKGNYSDHRRFLITMHYMTTRCRCYPNGDRLKRQLLRKLLREIRDRLTGKKCYRHQIYLARGVDLAGNTYTD